MIGALATTAGVGLWPLLAVPASLALVAGLLALLASTERWLSPRAGETDATTDDGGALRRPALEVEATEVGRAEIAGAVPPGALSAAPAEADLEPAIY